MSTTKEKYPKTSISLPPEVRRATFISAMDDAGVSAHLTDSITGHAAQGMHGRYSQPSRVALMEAVTRAVEALGV